MNAHTGKKAKISADSYNRMGDKERRRQFEYERRAETMRAGAFLWDDLRIVLHDNVIAAMVASNNRMLNTKLRRAMTKADQLLRGIVRRGGRKARAEEVA